MENARPVFAEKYSPQRFEEFRNRHAGESILVCGCGSSLNDLHEAEHYTTIGVNDIGRKFHPDYLVVLNGRHQFSPDRFQHIAESQAQALFTHLQLGIDHPNIVRFQLGQRGGVDITDDPRLPFTRNSPYVAVALAIYMGAKRIGLIGVDFTQHHFFAQTGQHSLSGELSRIQREYAQLAEASAKLGVEIVNLSTQSAIDTLPRQRLDEFAAQAKGAKSLNIVSYATTPVAGVPKLLSECIEQRTPHRCRTVWATNQYGNGVQFDGDVEWKRQPELALELLREADLVIVHNGHTDPRHVEYFKHKPVITMAHNYMWNVNRQFVERGQPGVVVGQYQASLPEFAQWRAVPNPVPLWSPLFADGEKDAPITIAYTPSGKHEHYAPNHRLYWHSKGYQTTLAVLQRLSQRYPLQLLTTQSRQVSFEESMAMKRRAHIVIDECVTGSYHRNSLEGLAAGAVVINGLGLKPEINNVFQQCSGETSSPFVYANLETLERTLIELIELGPQLLREKGTANRSWLAQHWDFSQQWQRFWLPTVQNALEQNRSPKSPVRLHRANTSTQPSAQPPPQQHPALPPTRLASFEKFADGVSVIIPFAGHERLAALRTTLQGLKTQVDIDRVIVVELDRQPNGRDIATACADDYVFARTSQPFNKSRAMNIGLPFVRTHHFLWLDGDLLLPAQFVRQAREECETRKLDCLIPWHTVHYLSEYDSAQVQAGACTAHECQPVHQFQSRKGAQGAAVLVRTEFALQHGGMFEQFQGWGGEDNAWFHKVKVLGKIDYTNNPQHQLHHLYHARSAGYCRHGEHIAANANYRNNFQLLNRIRALRNSTLLLKNFPPPPQHTAPWHGSRAVYCPPSHAALAERLRALYGNAIEVQQSPNAQTVDLSRFDLTAEDLTQSALRVIQYICDQLAAQHAGN